MGVDPSIPLLCKDATVRSERLLVEHRQLFPKWHMQLKSDTTSHSPAGRSRHQSLWYHLHLTPLSVCSVWYAGQARYECAAVRVR